jgi:hypothetical protein
MLESQIDQEERRRTLQNDVRVREHQREQAERRSVFAPDQSLPNPASTFHQHALADAETPRGRFTQVETATVIGSKPEAASAYPAAAAHQHDPVPKERTLGLSHRRYART